MSQFGYCLLVYGIADMILPYFGYRIRFIQEVFGKNEMLFAIACVVVGAGFVAADYYKNKKQTNSEEV